ncbi:MAG: hypothetical protein U0401_12755 [Anaerolineae bacterium]
MDFKLAEDRGLIRKFDPAWPYYEHPTTHLINMDIISNGELKVVVDSMYGAGRGVFREILSRTRTRLHELHSELNPVLAASTRSRWAKPQRANQHCAK